MGRIVLETPLKKIAEMSPFVQKVAIISCFFIGTQHKVVSSNVCIEVRVLKNSTSIYSTYNQQIGHIVLETRLETFSEMSSFTQKMAII